MANNRIPLAIGFNPANNVASGLEEFLLPASSIDGSGITNGYVLTARDGDVNWEAGGGGGGGAVNSVNDLTGDVDLYVSSLSGLDLTNLGGAAGEGDGLLPQIIEWDGANSQWKAVYEEQQFIRIKNNTGATLTKGQVVYAYGFQGDQALVGLAKSDSSTTMPSMGVVYADILDTESGIAVTFGTVDIDNTLTIEGSPAPGDTLYVSPNASGDLTATKPTATNHLIQNVGILLKAAPGAKVKVTGVGRSNDIPNTITLGANTITSASAKFANVDANHILISTATSATSSVASATFFGNYYTKTESDSNFLSSTAQVGDLSDVNGESPPGDGSLIQYQATQWEFVSFQAAQSYEAALENGSQLDHGILSGLGDDDHTQYVLADGTRPITGDLSAVGVSATSGEIATTPTAANHIANKSYVDSQIPTPSYFFALASGSHTIADEASAAIGWSTSGTEAITDPAGNITTDSSDTPSASIIDINTSGVYQVDCSVQGYETGDRLGLVIDIHIDPGDGTFVAQTAYRASNYASRGAGGGELIHTGTCHMNILLSLNAGDRLAFYVKVLTGLGGAVLLQDGTYLRITKVG